MRGRRAGTTRAALAGLALIALTGVLGACSDTASTRAGAASAGADDGPTTTAPQATVPKQIPKGTTLRVGDQLDYLKTLLSLAGEDKDFPYAVKYSSFIGGPPMLQAFQGGALDTGFVGSTPLVFAQSGNQGLHAVAGWASEHGTYGLLTNPAKSGIHGWKDLKGKRVAFQKGTAAEAAVLEALDTAGLKLSDITVVDVAMTQGSAALQSGSADAGISIEPLTSAFVAQNPGWKIVAKADELTDRSSFVLATDDVLDDPAKSAALGDYVARVVKAFKHVKDHPEQLAKAVYVKTYGLSPERANEVVAENGDLTFFELPGPIVKPQQRLADLFADNGVIPSELDVTAEFDSRYNDIVAEAAGS